MWASTGRRSLGVAVCGAAALLSFGLLCAGTPAERRPNFVLIYIDDLGWKDAGFLGSTYYETPSTDRLARQGMVFTNAYANAPNCAPSRACLLSGQYPPRHGIYTVGSSERGPANLRKWVPVPNKTILKASVVTIAEALKPGGYVSASIGKWHLGDDPASGPHSQGFGLNIGGNHQGHAQSYFSPYGLMWLSDGPQGEYLTTRLTDEALRFIETNKDRAFFLYLPHYAVHSPIEAKPELIEKYKKKTGSRGQDYPDYAAMIESTDQEIGRILGKLDDLGLAKTTVVFFLSDNGGTAGSTSMEPLRGSKGTIYEGGIRIPMIVRWPEKVRPGSVTDVPVSGVDLYPTILEMARVRRPPGYVLDGESLLPLLTGSGGLPPRAIFWHFPAYLEPDSGRKGPWKATPCSAVRQGDWKLIEQFEDGQLELYNLKDDIGERTNLAPSRKDKATELVQLLRDWRAATRAPVPTMKNPKYDPNAPVVMQGGAQTAD
jgi:arylsulfatase A-like enzyme